MKGTGYKLAMVGCLLATLLWSVTAHAITAQEIITLAQLGFSDQEIIKAIEKDRTVFRLEVNDIQELKNAGVPEEVIKFMTQTPDLFAGDYDSRKVVIAAGSQPVERQESVKISWVHSEPAGVDFAHTETTLAQYQSCVRAGYCGPDLHRTKSDTRYCNWGHATRGNHPMNCVNRYGAEQFCAWVGGRLPTEEEWYAAASNGGQWLYPWGDLDASCSTCIMDDASARGSGGGETAGCGEDRTWQVCSRRAGNSISGLCDMAGGLSEWTSTWKDSSQKAGVVRGGSWTDVGPDGQRASSRNWLEPAGAWGSVGFRCVRPSPAVPNKTGVASPPRAGAAEQAADEMVLIPAETFTMGCNRRVDVQCSDDEKPYHQVEIETYYIDRHEVTAGEYSKCVEIGPCQRGDFKSNADSPESATGTTIP